MHKNTMKRLFYIVVLLAVAIGSFLTYGWLGGRFASSPNLNRFGENPIGNEALVELYQLMPGHFDVKE